MEGKTPLEHFYVQNKQPPPKKTHHPKTPNLYPTKIFFVFKCKIKPFQINLFELSENPQDNTKGGLVRNMDLQEEIKSVRNGKYMSQYI